MRKRAKFLLCFIVSAMLVLVLGIQVLIPKEINLMVGKQESLSFNLPLKANIGDEEKIVVSGIDTEPVTENIEIDLNQDTILTPIKAGETKAEISAFGIPIKTVSVNIMPNKKLIPSGKIVGIVMKTEGVLVLGTGSVKGSDGSTAKPSDGVLRTGDIIISCNSSSIVEKEDLQKAIDDAGGNEIDLTIKRDNKESNVNITPVKNENNEYKIGVWIRDSTQGLGTVTFIDKDNKTYAALGHGVYDVDTKSLTPVSEGALTNAEIFGIQKGEAGVPGEVTGRLSKGSRLGSVDNNTDCGINGSLNGFGEEELAGEAYEIGLMQDVHEGNAVILSDVLGDGVKEYPVSIESINKLGLSADKGMVVKVTDQRLLEKTGGIIQGMSGSPIIQDNKIIGAVTHVFVKDPTKGYGIFIENMIQ